MSEPMSNFTPRAQSVGSCKEGRSISSQHGNRAPASGLINPQGVAVNALQKMGLDLDTVRQAVDEQVGLGTEAKPSGNASYRESKVLALPQRAKGLNHSYWGRNISFLASFAKGRGCRSSEVPDGRSLSQRNSFEDSTPSRGTEAPWQAPEQRKAKT